MQFSLRSALMLTALVAVTVWGASGLGRHDGIFAGALFVLWIGASFIAGWVARGSSARTDVIWFPVVAGLLVNWSAWFFVNSLLRMLIDPNTELVGDVTAGFDLLLDSQRLHLFLILAIVNTVITLLAIWKWREWTTTCVVAGNLVWGVIFWWGFIHASASLIYLD